MDSKKLTITCSVEKIADQTLDKDHALKVLARLNNGGWSLKEELPANATTDHPDKGESRKSAKKGFDTKGKKA